MTSTTAPPRAQTPAAPAGRVVRGRQRRPVTYLALVVAAVAFCYPFVWLVSASLKTRAHVFDNALLPSPLALGNYVTVWHEAPVLAWFVNSVVVGLAAAVAVTASSAVVAFGFAYFRFPGRNLWFGLVLATMMLPNAVTMVPVYLEWHWLGLASTQVPLWAQNLFGSAFFVFLLRQFFLTIPRETFEAARVDGASYLRMFWSVALPLARPGLIVVFIFELKNSWVDLLKPLIYLRDPQLYTLPRGLKAVLDRFGQGGEQQWEVVLAASVVATVPMIAAFFIAQRYFMHGLVTQTPTRG